MQSSAEMCSAFNANPHLHSSLIALLAEIKLPLRVGCETEAGAAA
jgi:hypothetical protein